jgi:WD40 repeat protein
VRALAFTRGTEASLSLISGSEDATVKIWDISNPELEPKEPTMTLRGHRGPVLSVEVDDRYVYSGGADGALLAW